VHNFAETPKSFIPRGFSRSASDMPLLIIFGKKWNAKTKSWWTTWAKTNKLIVSNE
jgi:hypothetical protein